MITLCLGLCHCGNDQIGPNFQNRVRALNFGGHWSPCDTKYHTKFQLNRSKTGRVMTVSSF